MALYSCPDCGHNLSDRALSCPGCGLMWRKRGWWVVTIGWGIIMSALISFLLTVLLIVVLSVAGVGLTAILAGLGSRPAPTSTR